jgi:hypothetical protein
VAFNFNFRYWFFAGLKKYMIYVFAYTTSAKEILWTVSGKFESLPEPEKPDVPEETAEVRCRFYYIIRSVIYRQNLKI